MVGGKKASANAILKQAGIAPGFDRHAASRAFTCHEGAVELILE